MKGREKPCKHTTTKRYQESVYTNYLTLVPPLKQRHYCAWYRAAGHPREGLGKRWASRQTGCGEWVNREAKERMEGRPEGGKGRWLR